MSPINPFISEDKTPIKVFAELVLRAANDLELFQKLSYKTLQLVEEKQSLDGNPLYAILHEPIYCQGPVFSHLLIYLSVHPSLLTLGARHDGRLLVSLKNSPNFPGIMSRTWLGRNQYISRGKWYVHQHLNPPLWVVH